MIQMSDALYKHKKQPDLPAAFCFVRGVNHYVLAIELFFVFRDGCLALPALMAAHLARWAAAMRSLASGDSVGRLFGFGRPAARAPDGPPRGKGFSPDMTRSAAARNSLAISSRCAIHASTFAITDPSAPPMVAAAVSSLSVLVLPRGRPRFFFANRALQSGRCCFLER
jgi:hypothetical protein